MIVFAVYLIFLVLVAMVFVQCEHLKLMKKFYRMQDNYCQTQDYYFNRQDKRVEELINLKRIKG